MQLFKENTKNLKVLTPDGYQSFAGVSYMGDREIYRVELEDGFWIECTDNHKIYINDTTTVEAATLNAGDQVATLNGILAVKSIAATGRIEPVYDLIGVDGGNRFYGNDILISNCEFIAWDETLINSIFLSEMDLGIEPVRRTGQVRWYDELEDDQTYIVALDPSLGTGGDPAAIQIFGVRGMRQIGEWQHNQTTIQNQIKIMREILEEIEETVNDAELYYSVENNTIGEAALISIEEMGEDNIPGTFISEPRRRGNVKRYRKGFNTTHSSKMTACSKLKRWVEEDIIKIKSKNLISELKTFVAKGTTYMAKDGETDDLVMSTLLAVRIAMQIAKHDEDAFETLKDSFDDVDYRKPMPVGFIM